jgi:hypothetical protein
MTYKKWFRRQVDAVSKLIVDHFGACIISLPSYTLNNDDGETIHANDASDKFDIRDFGVILAALAKKHEGLLEAFLDAVKEQRGVNALKLRMVEVEKATVDAIQKQFTPVAILLLAHLGVSHLGYQTLINATSWTTGDGESRASRVRCPLGTPLCRWPPLNHVLTEIKSTLGLTSLDLQIWVKEHHLWIVN